MTMTIIDHEQDQATETQNPSPTAPAEGAPAAPSNDDAKKRPGNDNAKPTPSNDNRRPGGAADTRMLATHPEFVEGVRRALIRFGRRRHLEDDIPEVQCRCLAAADVRMPPDLARWKALGRKVAKNYAIDEHIKLEERKKYDTGLCEEPDACGPIEKEGGRDPVDTSRYHGALKELFDEGAMPEMGGDILLDAADEAPQAETAEELGLSERQVKKRLKRMRVRYAERLDAIGLRDGVNTVREKSTPRGGT